jgi:hypothetical protein
MREVLVQIPANTGGLTVYVPAFENCTVLGAKVVNNTAPGGSGTAISLAVGSTTIGTVTVGAADGAATVSSMVMSSTLATRKTPVTATVPLKVVAAASTNSTAYDVLVRFDDSALTRD